MIRLYASRTMGAYALLELALGEAYGLSSIPELARAEGGKPYFPARPELHFNLSHSGGLCLCGVGDTGVGVDIELVRPRGAGLPRYALTEREYGAYLRQGGDWGAFYAQWTRREAWSKFTGAGVARSRGLDIPERLVLRSFAGADWRACACAEADMEAPVWR